ncbi:hypothetical protein GCM10027275_38240 [Rhabdobacter roseus]|uniref:Uncharacterized protein n=1 Tax=Rhabdobacter roseus TaxID=1655419 RepID=A0A840U035_9BACT|nr:hypothetical protein [Rhabdobacter roseus]MBB5285768.1 hypothetical protein [Rhabdobacter roseus]
MKKILYTLLACTLLVVSCTRSELEEPLENNWGCIERIRISVTDHSIDPAAVRVANALLAANNIDHSNLRYYQFLDDSVQTYYPPYAKFDNKIVKAEQYLNGL